MTEDERNLDLLGTFHYIVGGILALWSCIPIIHIVIGVSMLAGVFDGNQEPPRIIALLFVVLGSVFVIGGWCLVTAIIIAGKRLKRRESRIYCLVLAGVECIFMPFGTVLGVLTLIVITKPTVIELFNESETNNDHL